MLEVDETSSNGTIFFLYANQTATSAGPPSLLNLTIIAVNLTWGTPLFETPVVGVPSNDTNLTGVSRP